MHSHRFRYIFLGLLIYIQSAFCLICGSDHDDTSSRAFLAHIVFEGSLVGRYGHDTQAELLNPGNNRYQAYFSVKKVLKGSLPREVTGDRYKPVVAGDFGPYDDPEECVAKIRAGTNITYFVFLRANLNPLVPKYRISAYPQVVTKKSRNEIRDILCDNCAKPPKARLKPKKVTAKRGGQIKLRCRISGNPRPTVKWLKDGLEIPKRKGLSIKHNKRGSRLRIQRAERGDNGTYQCKAINLLGQDLVDVRVQLSGEVESHEEKCASSQQNFCLNGGTCYYLKTLGTKFCKCTADFMGERCQYRDIFHIIGELKNRDTLQFDRTMTIAGLIIAILVLAALCILAYCMAKHKREDFFRKKNEKERMKKALKMAEMKGRESVEQKKRNIHDGPITRSMAQAAMAAASPPPKPVRSTVTQTEDDWMEPAPPTRPPQNSPKLHHEGYPHSNHQNHHGRNGYQNNSPHRGPRSRDEESRRHRLPGMSSSNDIENARKELRSTSVVNAVVESERDPSKRSSPSQNSRTESALGHHREPRDRDRDGYPIQRMRQEDSDTMSQRSQGSQRSRGSRGSRSNGSMDIDQRSDYDNHIMSDMDIHHHYNPPEYNPSEYNPSEYNHPPEYNPPEYNPPEYHAEIIDTHHSPDIHADLGNNNNKVIKRIKTSKQGSSSEEESDSETSSSGMGEEQALFQQLSQHPRIVTQKNKFVSEPDLNPLWDGYNTHTWDMPNNYAFNPYAMDHHQDYGPYDHASFFPKINPNHRYNRKRQSLQERIMIELQDDTDATPV